MDVRVPTLDAYLLALLGTASYHVPINVLGMCQKRVPMISDISITCYISGEVSG